MSRRIAPGAADQTIYVEILDSASTTGGRKTGLVYNSAGLTAYYARNRDAAVQITLATLAAANSAHSDGGFKEVDASNMPGVYRLDLPDAAVAAGAPSVVVTIKGATDAAQVSVEIELKASGIAKNVAHADFTFVMTDDTLHQPKTDLDDADFTTKSVRIDGGAPSSLAGTITNIGGGYYVIDLAAGETNGKNLAITFAAADADVTLLTAITSD